MISSWKRLAVAAGALLPAIALAGCGTDQPTAGASSVGQHPSNTPPSESQPEPGADLPAGWKWESFRHVQVGVPDRWRDGASTTQLTSQWCIGDKASRRVPWVARPGISTGAGCFSPRGTDPGTLIAKAGTFVAFESSPERRDGVRHEGDRTTVTVGGIDVLIQAPRELRGHIAATVSTITADSNGCAVTHPLSSQPAAAPKPGTALGRLTGITQVSACKYALSSLYQPDAGGLLSSIQLRGAAAQASIRAIATLPTGSGPNAPATCTVESSYGDEAIVLLVRSDRGSSEIYLRYLGCDHHGFYDGSSVRALTRASVAPFITGSNTIAGVGVSGVVFRILGG